MRLLLSVLFSIVTLFADAQQITIKGFITDSKNSPLPGAAVILLNNDSSVINSAITSIDGRINFTTTATGDKLLKISFVGFRDNFKKISLDQPVISLGTITLIEKSTQLNELEVTEEKIPVQTKGDTIQYNADAYKVNRDANAEDLATKMPGISNQDGKMQAQGEEVKKVLIDGKPYMGDDPNAAMKNLPAEVIDKIQVFDKKSDQAEFTGFDDGNTSKTINIITRPQFRNGTFGRAYAGYGTDDHYKAGASINQFKDKRKLTFLGNINDINEQNFTTDDLLGVIGTNAGRGGPRGGYPVYRSGGGGGGGGNRYGPQNDASNFLVDQKNGIITTYAGGLNYVNTWNKLDFSASYFYNQSENDFTSILTRNYFGAGNDGLTYKEYNNGLSKNKNHRGNLKIEYKFDSLNSVLIQPRFSFQNNSSSTTIDGINSNPEGLLSILNSPYTSEQHGYNVSVPILYRHSFAKRGRTISLNLNPTANENTGSSTLNSLTLYYADTLASDTISQYSDNTSDGKSITSELTYTEPAGKKGQLSLAYRNTYTSSTSQKYTYSSDVLDSALSNDFKSIYIANTPTLSYRFTQENYNFMVGAGYQVSQLKNDQFFPSEGQIDRTFNSVLPSMMFQYKFTTKKNLRVSYRSANNAPSVNQLQSVINNTNPLQLTTGNPFLSQDWQNFFNIRYSATNSEKNTSFFTFFNFTYTADYIGSSSVIANTDTTINGIFLTEGTQLTRPVNLDNNYSARLYSNYSFPLKAIKSTLNVNVMGSYTNSPGMINDEINYSRYRTGGLGFALSSNISEKVDFLLSSNANYNNVTNTIETSSNSKYYSFNSKFRIQVMPFKGIVLQTDLTNQVNSGLTSIYNQNYTIWNASAGYKFLSKQQAELRLSIFDILSQNKSITRNTTDLYYEDVQTNVLKQYWMLTFTYNLKKFVSQTSNDAH